MKKLFLTSLVLLALPAAAANVTVDGVTCAYKSLVGDASGNVTFICNVSMPPVVTPPVVTPPVVTPPVSTTCTTRATYTQVYTGSKIYGPLGSGQTGAVQINVTPQMLNRAVKVSVVESISTVSGADIQFSLSTCPGDFDKVLPCSSHTQYTGGTLNFSIGSKPASVPWYIPVCELPNGTNKVYFNFRHIRRPTPVPPYSAGVDSCPGTCGNFVQVN